MKRKKIIVGLVGALVGCTVLASAYAAPPLLNPIGVRTSNAEEFDPASQGEWFSWSQASQAHPNRPNVYVQGSGAKIRVNEPGTNGYGSGIDGNTLVYYEYSGKFAGDIRMFNLQTHRRTDFPAKVSTRWDEYYPTISGPWVLFTRYISKTQVTKVLLYNMQTHALRTLGTARGSHSWVYSGQVNGDYAAWGRVRRSGLDVYLYRISTNTDTVVPRNVFAQYNPSVTSDGTIYYGRSGKACGAGTSLIRNAGGVATDVYDFPAGIDLGDTYVDERTDGSLQLFYGQFTCHGKGADIYKGIDSYTIDVANAGSGTGTVTSDRAGIDCGTACQSIFHGGATVTLTATPDPGSVFSGWSDASCGTNATCPVDVESDVSLTATFDPSP